MKYCRFSLDGLTHYGKVEDRNGEFWIADLIPAPEEDLKFRIEHGRSTSLALGFEPLPLAKADLLPPVTPSKIVCVGRNYRDHVRELGHEMPVEPLIFLKPPSSLLPPGGAIRLPAVSERVDYEGELAVVIGRRARHLKPGDSWRGIVRGFTLANDVSARDLQKKDDQWTRAKGFDTFCPAGPIVSDELDLEAGLAIETRLNGEVRQHASTLDFIFPLTELLTFITSVFTLEPGDLLLTGTPAGVGPIKPGDRVEVSIPGLGVLSNTVEADAS
ncbi:MAG: fumarylacetoacetate hydrolase family protein [Terracidiphilus sp.]|jgi:2-keto-4-pentenoate hydratase/2-oxohepta-3-ene-1,7-dioic acid hydratase in catechol pathway